MWIAATVSVLGGSVSQLALRSRPCRSCTPAPVRWAFCSPAGCCRSRFFRFPRVLLDRSSKRAVIVAFNLLGCAALGGRPAGGGVRCPVDAVAVRGGFPGGLPASASAGQRHRCFITQLVGRDRLGRGQQQASLGNGHRPACSGPVTGRACWSAWLGAPMAVTLDALAFLAAAALVGSVSFPRSRAGRLEVVRYWPTWRKVCASSGGIRCCEPLRLMAAMFILLFDGFMALYVLYATRGLH